MPAAPAAARDTAHDADRPLYTPETHPGRDKFAGPDWVLCPGCDDAYPAAALAEPCSCGGRNFILVRCPGDRRACRLLCRACYADPKYRLWREGDRAIAILDPATLAIRPVPSPRLVTNPYETWRRSRG